MEAIGLAMLQVEKGIRFDGVILVSECSEGFVHGELHLEEGSIELSDEEDRLEVGLPFLEF